MHIVSIIRENYHRIFVLFMGFWVLICTYRDDGTRLFVCVCMKERIWRRNGMESWYTRSAIYNTMAEDLFVVFCLS